VTVAIDINALPDSSVGFKTHWGIDEYLFTAQGNDLNHGRKADKITADGFGLRVKNSLAGQMEGNAKLKGVAAMRKGKMGAIIGQRFGRTSPVNFWYAVEGLAQLAPITMQPSTISDFSLMAKTKDAVEYDLEMDARGDFSDGVILLSPKNLLAGATGAGPDDDNSTFGGSSTAGAYFQVHLWALTGGTAPTVVFKLQGSPDGTTWTDLTGGAFASMAAIGSQRLSIPSTTPIPAHVRAFYTVAGAPTEVQALLGGGRRPDLDA